MLLMQGSRQKKSSKEPLAPIREKLRRQIIFLVAAEQKFFYFIIIILFFSPTF